MSYILSQILKKKSSNWNKIIWTEEITYQECDSVGVRYKEIEKHDCQGEYIIYADQPFILLRKELKQQMKTWVLLHELGHHLLHYPVNHKFSKSIIKRMDAEANYFAAIALMPTWLIETLTFEEIKEDYNYPDKLLLIRKEIAENYQI